MSKLKNWRVRNMSRDLISPNDNFFDKLVKFFKELFNSNKDNSTETEDDDVLDYGKLKEEEKVENDRLLNLQKQYENGEITEDNISEEDKEKLKLLYANQLEGLDYAINAQKKVLEGLKDKIVEVKNN